MRLHRLGADREARRDGLGGMAFGDQLQHLALAHRQRVGRVLWREVGLGHGAGNPGAQVYLAAADPFDGLHQIARGLTLQDVALDATAQGLGDVLLLVVLCQHHELHARTDARQLERRVQPVELRHADIEHGHIGVLAAHQTDRLAAVGGLAGDHEARALQQRLQALPDEYVIVGEHESYAHRHLPRGRLNLICAPCPGAETMCSVPPSAPSRSRMPRRPSPPRRTHDSTSKPTPSSLIRQRSESSS